MFNFYTSIADQPLKFEKLHYYMVQTSFIDPICCNFCMVLSMFLGWFWPNFFIFSARHQLDTWTLAPQKARDMA